MIRLTKALTALRKAELEVSAAVRERYPVGTPVWFKHGDGRMYGTVQVTYGRDVIINNPRWRSARRKDVTSIELRHREGA